MYKRYCKTNTEDYIYDLFFERQIEKFDGTEKLLDEVESPADVWINNKGIFDEAGNPLFKFNNGNPIEIPNTEKLLKYLKKKQNELISDAFEQEFISGTFLSDAIGIVVDCRRDGLRNDAQNVEGIIKSYNSRSEERKRYKGKTETTATACTLEQYESLLNEMINVINSRYVKKGLKQIQISQAATPEAVKSIVW